jgi:ubiquinone/menaquinone biosynthesis C-methylase UbiE
MTRPQNPKSRPRRTPEGWDAVAEWYDGWVGKGGSVHHKKLAIPAVLDLLDAQSGEAILDIGAGQGVLAPYIAKTGAHYTGVDVSNKLLALARKHHGEHGRFLQADAVRLHDESSMQAEIFDAAVFLLSIQDIDPLDAAIRSAAWVLKPQGRMIILMTHPAFRIPRQSGWGFDEGRKLQYRRIDRYLTPLDVPMKQHPGRESGVTISRHRPLSDYVNTLADCGLYIERLLEIPATESPLNKQRTKAEKLADAEIPLFLALRTRKLIT